MNAHMFQHIFAVNSKRQLYTLDDVASVEKVLQTQLPASYTAFISTLGSGLYCDFVRILSLEQIIERHNSEYTKLMHYNYTPFTLSELHRSITIASSIDGDAVVYIPGNAEQFFVLPRHDNVIYLAPYGMHDLCYWVTQEYEVMNSSQFLYFSSLIDRDETLLHVGNNSITIQELVDCIKDKTPFKIHHVLSETSEFDEVHRIFIPEIEGKLDLYIEYYDDGQYKYSVLEYDKEHYQKIEALERELKRIGLNTNMPTS
jgi:hypothetical protein